VVEEEVIVAGVEEAAVGGEEEEEGEEVARDEKRRDIIVQACSEMSVLSINTICLRSFVSLASLVINPTNSLCVMSVFRNTWTWFATESNMQCTKSAVNLLFQRPPRCTR
jgi:hypothetical protein